MSLILLNTSNNTLHTDLHIPFVREVAKQLKIPQDSTITSTPLFLIYPQTAF